MEILKISEEEKKKLEKEDDNNNWFDIDLVVTADHGEPEKHFGGRVKLKRIWDDERE